MVGAVYGPELYAGKCCPSPSFLPLLTFPVTLQPELDECGACPAILLADTFINDNVEPPGGLFSQRCLIQPVSAFICAAHILLAVLQSQASPTRPRQRRPPRRRRRSAAPTCGAGAGPCTARSGPPCLSRPSLPTPGETERERDVDCVTHLHHLSDRTHRKTSCCVQAV